MKRRARFDGSVHSVSLVLELPYPCSSGNWYQACLRAFSSQTLTFPPKQQQRRRLERVSHCYIVCERWKIPKKDITFIVQTCYKYLFNSILRALMTSYRLRWQHVRSTKRSSMYFSFWKLSEKISFYFFVGNLPKFINFLESMTISYK